MVPHNPFHESLPTAIVDPRFERRCNLSRDLLPGPPRRRGWQQSILTEVVGITEQQTTIIIKGHIQVESWGGGWLEAGERPRDTWQRI